MRWLLLVDLDGTLWDHEDISLLTPPFKQIAPGIIIDKFGVKVKLNKDMIKFIEWARNNGAITSTLSWNIFDKAYAALKAFNVTELFDYITIEDTYRKDKMIKKLLHVIRKNHGLDIPTKYIVYIDDRDIHIDDIYENIGKVFFIKYSINEDDIDDLILKTKSYLVGAGLDL